MKITSKSLQIFACDCAFRALTREREAGREPDERLWKANTIARAYAMGRADRNELRNAAAEAAAVVVDAEAAAGRFDAEPSGVYYDEVASRDSYAAYYAAYAVAASCNFYVAAVAYASCAAAACVSASAEENECGWQAARLLIEETEM